MNAAQQGLGPAIVFHTTDWEKHGEAALDPSGLWSTLDFHNSAEYPRSE
jgi:hypothetical protein